MSVNRQALFLAIWRPSVRRDFGYIVGMAANDPLDLLDRAISQTGAIVAGVIGKSLFVWLTERHFPDRKEKILHKVLSLRDGKLYDPKWFDRQRGHGPYAAQVEQLFAVTCRKLGLSNDPAGLSAAAFRNPAAEQLGLF